jgi:nucleoside-diphosphate-sugar epimerase
MGLSRLSTPSTMLSKRIGRVRLAPARGRKRSPRFARCGQRQLTGKFVKALVTGATGFLGPHLVRSLLAQGHGVRILVRSAQRAEPLARSGAEVRLGDLSNSETLRGVAQGVDTIFHLARSATHASAEVFERVDVRGTEALLSEAEGAGVRRIVFVGTLAGFPLAQMADGSEIDEQCPFDESGLLGNYARSKARAEGIVLGANGRGGLECVVIRLGLVCGPGTPVLPSHVCLAVSPNWAVLFGDGRVPLPLTLVDNAVDALVLGATTQGISGEVFHIVDDDTMTQRGYLQLLRITAGGRPRVVQLPRVAYYALGTAMELFGALRGVEPSTNRYRIRGRLRRVRWNCEKARRVLQWKPRIALRVGLTDAFRGGARSAN